MLIDSMAKNYKFNPKKQEKFLELFAETGNIKQSCTLVKISQNTVYRLRKKSKKFAEAWEEAESQGVDSLIAEARRRAYEGVDEPVFYKGEHCGLIRKYSDTLLIFLIKAKRPEYRDNYQMNLSGDLTVKIVKFADGSKTAK